MAGLDNVDWTRLVPQLRDLAEPVRARLATGGRVVGIPEGARLFGPGQTPERFVILLEGSVRVQQGGLSGREIVLYRVFAGETCALTTACLMSHDAYEAEAIAETNVKAAIVPMALFEEMIATSAEFRNLVFKDFGKRMANLLRVIDEVAFGRIDVRLAQRLLALAAPDGRVRATHQQLGSELGTAREVVSRQISDFQHRGWIRTKRGEIEIAQRNALRSLADTA